MGAASAPPPRRGSYLGFLGGAVLGLVAAILPAIFLGLLFGQEGGPGPWIACLAEIAGFAILVLLARRLRWVGFPQGLLVGGALAFLLGAACWGYVGVGS